MFSGFVLYIKILCAFISTIVWGWIIWIALIIPLFPCIIIIRYIKKSFIKINICVIFYSNSTFNQLNNAETLSLLRVQRNYWICIFARFYFCILILKILRKSWRISLKLSKVEFLIIHLVDWLKIILNLLFFNLSWSYLYTQNLRYC